MREENIDFKKYSKLCSDYAKQLKQLEKTRRELCNLSIDENGTWRNIRVSYWRDLCKEFGEDKLINNYGDVFYIEENHEKWFICRRINWGMTLSSEKYQVEEFDDYSDGEYGGVDYEVTLIEEE